MTAVPSKEDRASPTVGIKLWGLGAFGAVLFALGCVCGGLVWGHIQRTDAEKRAAVRLAEERDTRVEAERRGSIAATEAARADTARTEVERKLAEVDKARTEAERRLAEVERRVVAERRAEEEKTERERKAVAERETRSVLSGRKWESSDGICAIDVDGPGGMDRPKNGDVVWYTKRTPSTIVRIEGDVLYGYLHANGYSGRNFWGERIQLDVIFRSDADVAIGEQFPISQPFIFDGTNNRGTRIIRFLTKAEMAEAAEKWPAQVRALKQIHPHLFAGEE